MVAILGYSREQIFRAVQHMYTRVAKQPADGFHFPTGTQAASRLGYPQAELESLPEPLLQRFAGVGYPFNGDAVGAGDVVLDVGAGAGNDSIIAARRSGETGLVIALDLTAAMTHQLAEVVREHGPSNVVAVQASAERIPLRDASVDSVTSNGALNLVPDKRRAVCELFRVLRPGGRLQIADVVIRRPVTVDCDSDPRLWVECVVGATVEENLLELFRDAGFEDIRLVRRVDYFAESPSAQTRKIARSFGAHSVEFATRRGVRAPSGVRTLLRRCNPVRLFRHLRRQGLLGLVALVVALASCYGTLAAVAVVALTGVTLAIDPALWAGTISVLALLTLAAVAAGLRDHGDRRPMILAAAGTAVLLYTLLLSYHPLAELTGFVLLGAATFWDRHIRRQRQARVLGLPDAL